jgi:soluble epoxide hydrolase / lipid-phosphate phosphatase
MDGLTEKQILTKRNLEYRYYISHSGDHSKPTLLLLHGWPDNALLWQYVIPYLLPLGLKIIVPDLLGYGGTSKPTNVNLYDHRLMTQDVVEILDAEGVDKVIPIGHDFGCWFTFKFQVNAPERCLAAVHIGIAYMPPIPVMPDLETLNAITEHQVGYPRYSYFHLFTAPDAPELFSKRLDSVWHVMHGDRKDWTKYIFCTPNAMREWLEADGTDVPLKPYAQDERLRDEWKADKRTPADWEPTFCWYRAFTEGIQSEADKTIPEERYKLQVPVLAIMCTGDGVNPVETLEAPKQAGLFAELTEKVMEVGHWCTYERPDELSRLIIDYLEAKSLV